MYLETAVIIFPSLDKLPKSKTAESAQDGGQHLVVGIKYLGPVKTPKVYVDRSETDLDNLLTDLNAEFRANPNRGLLIKGSKNLPWKEAYKVMNTINEGGMSTTVSLTATIGIPNMVDQFNVNRTLQQGDGAVEFFADSLTNLNSTAVIPAAAQVGYTTTNLGYSNPVEGDVCNTGVNDSKYFARAAEAKPITAPSSTFFVYFQF